MTDKGESFTEFYILGPDGNAYSYPRYVNAGENITVIIGINNREHVETSYVVSVKTGDVIVNRIEPISLVSEQKWERPISITIMKSGNDQKLEFLLYKKDQVYPYLSLALWINVR
jgi:uncharacterized membrane protein